MATTREVGGYTAAVITDDATPTYDTINQLFDVQISPREFAEESPARGESNNAGFGYDISIVSNDVSTTATWYTTASGMIGKVDSNYQIKLTGASGTQFIYSGLTIHDLSFVPGQAGTNHQMMLKASNYGKQLSDVLTIS